MEVLCIPIAPSENDRGHYCGETNPTTLAVADHRIKASPDQLCEALRGRIMCRITAFFCGCTSSRSTPWIPIGETDAAVNGAHRAFCEKRLASERLLPNSVTSYGRKELRTVWGVKTKYYTVGMYFRDRALSELPQAERDVQEVTKKLECACAALRPKESLLAPYESSASDDEANL